MRYFMPDPSELTGGDPGSQPLKEIPTGMEDDPTADQDIIDQRTGGSSPEDEYPEPAPTQPGPAKIVPDDLAASIAYALDGSGPGPTNAKPNVSGHKVITEGITGASLSDEEEAMRS